MKKTIFSIIIIFAALSTLYAIPAKRGMITYTQPDGSKISLYNHGDEWFHYLTDENGRYFRQAEDGFFKEIPEAEFRSFAQKAAERSAEMRQKRMSAYHAGEHPAMGKKHFLVILVQFSDQSFITPNAGQVFHGMMNQAGFSDYGATGSARDYFYENSHGLFEPLFDVFGPVTLPHNVAYYGGNDNGGYDKHPEEAVIDGIKALQDQLQDLSKYDNDSDGKVDVVYMYYAGFGEADGGSADTIWPHQWYLSSAGKSLSINGIAIDKYACSNEIAAYNNKIVGIGAPVHEFSHALGLPDFYDTDYETNGQSAGLFSFSVMDGGTYNNDSQTPPYYNIVERIMLGWVEEKEVLKPIAAEGLVTIPPINENIAYYTTTDMDGEYFLYECRTNTGWDSYLPGYGMLVYHADKSQRTVKLANYSTSAYNLWGPHLGLNSINENGKHPCFYIVPAADQSNLFFGYEYYEPGGFYYYNDSKNPQIPFPGSKKVNYYTPLSWNEVKGPFNLENITFDGNKVTFTAMEQILPLDYHVIANPGKGVYALGDSFKFALESSGLDDPKSVEWYFDEVMAHGSSIVLSSPGHHTIEAIILLNDGSKQVIDLEIEVKG